MPYINITYGQQKVFIQRRFLFKRSLFLENNQLISNLLAICVTKNQIIHTFPQIILFKRDAIKNE